MASIGTLYAPKVNFRGYKARIVAEYNNVAVEMPADFDYANTSTAEYRAKFPVGKLPGLELKDGSTVFDSNAIAYYIAGLKENSPLVGRNHRECTEILQYIMFAESDLMPALVNWLDPILGLRPYNKVAINESKENVGRFLTALNQILLTRTFLVGERLTLADVIVVCDLVLPYKIALSPEFRAPFKNVTRYFWTCINQPEFRKIIGDIKFLDQEPTYVMSKKEKAPKTKTAAPAKKAAVPAPAPAPAAEEPKPEPKPKSKLDLLPPSPFNLEAWKRFYSNNDTKPDAMNYFWENYDPEGYSLWKMQFKYNPELTLTFMSANQIGGFFARLERARKYAFGSVLVLGQNNDNEIRGYFVIRGQEVPFEITDAPDYESYEFTKVDHTDPKIKEEVADYFAWEGPTLPREVADGKVFK
ncbi:hypothetical protein H4R34_001825 [Dimargaris verticillata]|uniref:Elongation factor 1-gamma n=1 Tax=Dimargaris verticillata TaxID=2761393 RepID=A0A9W8B9Z4_9FUNG|nr:hypothetical protein H4R34_001825 [Dimargaris verticillata]